MRDIQRSKYHLQHLIKIKIFCLAAARVLLEVQAAQILKTSYSSDSSNDGRYDSSASSSCDVSMGGISSISSKHVDEVGTGVELLMSNVGQVNSTDEFKSMSCTSTAGETNSASVPWQPVTLLWKPGCKSTAGQSVWVPWHLRAFTQTAVCKPVIKSRRCG